MRIFFLILSFLYSLVISAGGLHPEDRLLNAIVDIQTNNISEAELTLEKLVNDIPDFKLAQLVYADILISKIKPLPTLAVGLDEGLEKSLLLTEIKNRYQSINNKKQQAVIPSVLARLDSHYKNAIVIDLSISRLYLFDNSQATPVLINDYFVSMGRSGAGKITEGDLKTPLGVYFIQSYLPPERLADKYGAGAYPINYPNVWDKMMGKTGHGIWLHGTRSGTYNRPPLASEGCVVLPNDDLLKVGAHIDLKNTPILIGENIQWLSIDQWFSHQKDVNSIYMAWKNAWESLDVEQYIKHYSENFSNGKKDYRHWVDHKRRVAKYKTFVQVKLSNVSLLEHPNENVMVATFLQHYTSDNFSSESWKRQYWHKEDDGQWRIVFEGKISAPVSTRIVVNTIQKKKS